MDCAGITDHQQQLARLAATEPLIRETMSLALVQEYPLIHEIELSRGRKRQYFVRRPFPHRPSNRFQPARSTVSRAYWSHADEESENDCWEDEHDANDDENDVSDDAAYWSQSCGPDGEFGDVVDRMEQSIVCAFVASDCSLSDEDVCEDISDHAERAAIFGCEQARQHGVHVEKVVHSFRPKSELEKFDVQDLWTEGSLGWRSIVPKFCWKSISTWQFDEAVERQLEQRRVEDRQEAHEGQRSAERFRETQILLDESAIQSRRSHCASHE